MIDGLDKLDNILKPYQSPIAYLSSFVSLLYFAILASTHYLSFSVVILRISGYCFVREEKQRRRDWQRSAEKNQQYLSISLFIDSGRGSESTLTNTYYTLSISEAKSGQSDS